ncbi:MAG: hypothetical protein JHC98_07765 [Thermoleophilaceae bacterium]|nr:hypothetical protein [Thermoleophilaceae bacterium]
MDQHSRRKAAVLVNALAIAVCLLVVSGAGAKIVPSVTTSLTLDQVVPTGNTGATTTITVPAVKLGQHSDLTVDMNFGYGATGLVSLANGYGVAQDPATYPEWRSSLKTLVVDTPPGLVGNPNAVPFAERCPMDTFLTDICPASSTVGEFTIKTLLLPAPEDTASLPLVVGDNSYIGATIGPRVRNGGITRVSLLQTDPEVPALIGIRVLPWFSLGGPILTVMKVVPDTNGDLRLRTTTPDGIRDTIISKPTDDPPNTTMAAFRIDKMVLKLWGRLKNGRAFMTNPTACKPWASKIWAKANFDNTNLDADPLGTGAPDLVAGNESTITPDCTNGEDVPFPISGNVAISSPNRSTSPSFDFTITNPGVQADGDIVSTTPKTIVTTIPASINVDVQQLGRVCQAALFKADNCPLSSRVGTVKIETPLLLPGLSGDVFLVKQNSSSGLPDLGLRLRGAISFTQLGTNRYVGAKYNQIETTFRDIPQIGFSKLTFHLDGGPNGLLRSLDCPTYNKAPALPTFTYNFTAWTGATATSTTPLNMSNCFGIQQLKKYSKCLHSILPIHPNYQSRSRVRSVVLKVDGKRKASRKHSPFRFDIPIKKLKLKPRKRHTFELKATYDDKSVSKKTATFRVCTR